MTKLPKSPYRIRLLKKINLQILDAQNEEQYYKDKTHYIKIVAHCCR